MYYEHAWVDACVMCMQESAMRSSLHVFSKLPPSQFSACKEELLRLLAHYLQALSKRLLPFTVDIKVLTFPSPHSDACMHLQSVAT